MDYPRSMQRLRTILDELRTACPWDRKQTLHTLRPQTIEELYELTDAVSREDWGGIEEELGDLLLHIVFYSKIAAEQQQFTFDSVVGKLCDKLVARHPHVYGSATAADEAEVKKNWEQLKVKKEGKKSVLSGVPDALPPLSKSVSLQEKVKQVGFEWARREQVAEKVQEEWAELQEAIDQKDPSAITGEFGDLLFSLINYARYLNVDPDQALEKTNKKFKFRFQQIEAMAAAADRTLQEMSLEEMDRYWDKAKKMKS